MVLFRKINLLFFLLLSTTLANAQNSNEVYKGKGDNDPLYYRYNPEVEGLEVCAVPSGENPYYGKIEIPVEATISVAGEPMTFGVVGICKDAFKNCSLLSSVDIPSSVTSIGSNAFNGCSNYTVNFSSIDHVLSIEYGNPDSNPMYTAEITTIGGKILSEIQIDTDIRPYAFVKATWLKEVVLGDNVKNINNKAFYGCNNLKTLVIPSVTSIGTNAFEGCKSLTEIEFPPTLTSIGKEAFRNCTGLQYIVIPENINDIYGSAFYGCNNLIDLIISNRTSTLLIAENAFSSLKHIYSKALTMPQAHINAFGGKTDIQLFYKSEVNYDVDGTPWKALKKSPITSNTISYYLDGELYNELKDVEAGTLIDPLGRPDSDRDFSRWKNEPRIMPNEAVDVNGSLKYKLTYVAGDTDDQLNKEDIFYFYGDLISDPKELTKDGLTYVITNSIQTMPANDDYKVRVVYSLKDDKVPTAKTGLKFNNTEQDLVNYKSLKEGSGKITYSLDNETFSDKITAKDVGSYPVYYRVEDITKKYCTASGSLPDPVTISPAASSLTKTPTAKTITYDGTDQVLINEGASSTGTLQYKLKEENEFSKTIPTGKDAGDYIVNYKVKGDANHSDSEIGSVKVTIAKRKPSSINWKENYNFVYDGNAKEPKITVKWKDEEGKEYDVPEDQYSLSYEKNINVGTATVTITDKEGGNYNVGGIKSFTINKASIELGDDLFETPPSVKNGLVFKGAADAFAGIAQDLITGGTLKNPEIGTLEYSTNGKDFSEDIPTGIDAKKYSVYYRVKGSDNYNNSAISSAMEVKIAPKELTPEEIVITLSPSSYTYDGSEKKPGVTVKFGNTEFTKDKDYTVSYSNNKFVGTEEKQPTVTIKDKDGGNYIVSGSKTFEITRAASSMTKTPTAKTVTYDGTDQVLINEGASSTGTLQYKLKEEDEFSETIPTGKNAGDYTVYFRVKGDTNHSDSEISQVKVTIDPKEITFFNLSQASYTYDGSEKKPDVTVKDGNTTVSIEEYTVSYTNNTNVGTATVTITDKEGGNYNVSGIKTFTITKADIELKDDLFATPPAGIKDLIFNGTADAFAGTSQALIDAKTGTLKEPVPGTLEYSTDGKNFAVDIPTGTDAITYKVYYRVKGDANHNNSAISKAVEVSIAPKELKSNEIEITLSQNTFTYTGSEIKPDVTVKFGNTEFTRDKDYTVSYSNNKAVGTEENPPTVTIKDKDGGNYIVSGSKTFEIKRAASSLTKKPTAKTVTYDGTDQALINAGETSTGTLQYRLSEDEEFSEMIPTRKNAGDYTVYYRVKGDTNHSDS